MRLKKLSPGPAKLLKSVHLFFVSMWIGGLLAWLPLVYGLPLQNVEAVHTTYVHLRDIAWNVIGWGGIGSFLTGLLNGLLTHWGIFKYRWVTVKLLVAICMILFGMFFTEEKMLANLELLAAKNRDALNDRAFLSNHNVIQLVVPLQLAVFFLVVLISVFKPWSKKKPERS